MYLEALLPLSLLTLVTAVGFCVVRHEVKFRKRLKKHKRGDVLEFL